MSGCSGEPLTLSASQLDAAMQSIISVCRSAVRASMPSTHRFQSKLFIESSGITAQSPSRQHAPSLESGASGQSVSTPPCAQFARAPSVVSSPALQAASNNSRQSVLSVTIGPQPKAVHHANQKYNRYDGQ